MRGGGWVWMMGDGGGVEVGGGDGVERWEGREY